MQNTNGLIDWELIVIIGIAFICQIVAGLLAGRKNDKKSFFYGLLGSLVVTLLMIGAFGFSEVMQKLLGDWKTVLQFSGAPLNKIYFRLWYKLSLLCGTIGTVIFLAIYNLRRNSAKYYHALFWFFGGGIALSVVSSVMVVTILLSNMLLFVTIENAISSGWLDYTVYFNAALVGWLIVSVGVCILWTILVFRSKTSSWKNILKFWGYYLLIIFGLWGISCLNSKIACKWAQLKAIELNITPRGEGTRDYCQKHTLTTKELNDFDFESYAFPCYSNYDWSKNEVPQDKLEYTLKNFDSPNMQKYLRNLEDITDCVNNYSVILPVYNRYRELAKLYCSRAVLFKLTDKPDKMFEEYMKYVALDKKISDDSDQYIAILMRTAARSIWVESIVLNGVDNPKYAPYYREILNVAKSWQVCVNDEAGFYLGNSFKSHDNLANFLSRPVVGAFVYRGFSYELSKRPMLEKLEKTEVFDPSKKFHSLENGAYKQRKTIVMAQIASALKLYRVEKGFYPDSLEKLVPQYLEKLPPNPTIGKDFSYKTDGINFELSADSNYIINTANKIKL